VARAIVGDEDRVVLGAGEIHLLKRAGNSTDKPELCCDGCKRSTDEYLQNLKVKRDAAGQTFTVMELKAGAFGEYLEI